MCVPSVVADDWISKGCHIKVDGIELALRPDHLGVVVFSTVFSSPPGGVAEAAIRRAGEECLPDNDERKRWIESIQRAKAHLMSHRRALRQPYELSGVVGGLPEISRCMIQASA